MNQEKKFHKERVAFAVIDSKLLFLENSDMSHEEWLVESEIIDRVNFNEITRGFAKDGNIYFYKGDFETDEKVEEDSLVYASQICSYCKMPIPNNVYCGMNKGEIGSIWTPIRMISVI